MAATGCSVPGCARAAAARGLCRLHYKRGLANGDPGPIGPLHEPRDGPCTVEGCSRPASAKTLCRGHYQRLISTGQVGSSDIPARTPRGLYTRCAVEGCDRPHSGNGLCGSHLRRQRRTGDPGPPFGPVALPLCTSPACGERAHARGLCRRHYDQDRRARPSSP